MDMAKAFSSTPSGYWKIGTYMYIYVSPRFLGQWSIAECSFFNKVDMNGQSKGQEITTINIPGFMTISSFFPIVFVSTG